MDNGPDTDDLDAQLLKQMFDDFMEESQEHLDTLNTRLARLEEDPRSEEVINEIFRNVHTLKGTASFVGLHDMSRLAHRMEDVFGAVRKGALQVNATIIDTMFEGLEILGALRAKASAGTGESVDISSIVEKLTRALGENCIPPPAKATDSPERDASRLLPDALSEDPMDDDPSRESVSPDDASPLIRKVFRSETIRVSTGKLDDLVNLGGELITNRNRLNEFAERLKDENLSAIAAAIHRLTGHMHAGLMSMRMVPAERLFNKFPGVVRGLAREKNKEVEFTIEGQETELDKTIIEQLYDPLIHLLRNAVDHGIEPPRVRESRGKSPTGRLGLSCRHQQNNIIIEVADDGEGINPEAIRATAVRKGFVSREAARALTPDQAVRLIFSPGFSTTEEVTNTSGRGVGMDVVAEHVLKLRGMIDVRTAPGKGTMFQIQLPLTLATLQVLLVKVSDLTYALPLSSVRETILLDSSEIKTMEKQEVVFIRGVAYPLKKLGSMLKCGPEATSGITKGMHPIVVVGPAEKRVALAVDELVGKQEIVMKSLGDYLGKVEGIEGASILADGSVTLIVDMGVIVKRDA